MKNEDLEALKARANFKDKVVELSLDDFQSLIEALKMCKENENKLKESVIFLNNQIKDYNKNFAN